MDRRLPVVLGLVAAVLLLPGCGFVFDAAVDRAGDEAADLDVSTEDGAITIEGDQGSLTLRGPGGEAGEGEGGEAGSIDGDGSAPAADAPSLELFPDGFTSGPADLPEALTIPVPAGGTVHSGASFAEGGLVRLDAVVVFSDSEWDRVVAFYDEFADRSGMTRTELEVEPGPVVVFVRELIEPFVGVTIAAQGREVAVHIEDVVASGR